MSSTLAHYYQALERLKKRKAKINNDTVAIEAGRKKGSIKKSRPQFAELINDIDKANRNINDAKAPDDERFDQTTADVKALREQLNAALGREVSLLAQVFELRKKLATLTGANVIPLREADRKKTGRTAD